MKQEMELNKQQKKRMLKAEELKGKFEKEYNKEKKMFYSEKSVDEIENELTTIFK